MSNLGLRSDVVQYIPPVGSGLTTAVSVSSGNGSSVERHHCSAGTCAARTVCTLAGLAGAAGAGKYNDNTISVGYALRHRYDIADLRYLKPGQRSVRIYEPV